MKSISDTSLASTPDARPEKGQLSGRNNINNNRSNNTTATTKTATLVVKLESLFDGYLLSEGAIDPLPLWPAGGLGNKVRCLKLSEVSACGRQLGAWDVCIGEVLDSETERERSEERENER